jgi:malonyl-CoA O-methyltransferase
VRDVVRQFSDSATYYDRYSDIQRRVFDHLHALIPEFPYRQILDLGSGTGAMTALLATKHPEAMVTGVDVAPKMVMFAQSHYGNSRVHFECGRFESFCVENKADLVFSNATFQWVANPVATLTHVHDQMGPGAPLVLSSFGPETYRELATVIRQVWGHPVITSASQFLDGTALHACLSDCFETVQVQQCRYQRDFESLADLLRSIKHTGTRGLPEGPKHWTPGLFREVERAYLAHYRRIVATYQVYYCTARCR